MTLVVGFSAAAFRARFPVLERHVHLAACSLAPRSAALDAALARMLDAMAADGLPWARFHEEAERARRAFAALIGARPGQVALVPSASAGARLVASLVPLGPGSRVFSTEEEFPSVADAWRAAQGEAVGVARAGRAPAEGAAEAVVEGYRALIDDRTALVSVPLVTHRTGTRMPVEEVGALARAAGAPVFVDAYQAAGALPVDVGALGCDYLVAGSMKYLLGLPGVAFLYARDGFAGAGPVSTDTRWRHGPQGAQGPDTGTPAVAALYAANAGLGMLEGLDLVEVQRHIGGLVGLAAERLAWQGEQVAVARDPRDRGPHLAIAAERPADLARWLATRGVVVSPIDGLVRMAFHFYSDDSDVEAVCAAVRGYRWSSGGQIA